MYSIDTDTPGASGTTDLCYDEQTLSHVEYSLLAASTILYYHTLLGQIAKPNRYSTQYSTVPWYDTEQSKMNTEY